MCAHCFNKERRINVSWDVQMGTDAGVDNVGVQEHWLITPNHTQLWSDDRNWVLVYGSSINLRQGGVGILMSKSICVQVSAMSATFFLEVRSWVKPLHVLLLLNVRQSQIENMRLVYVNWTLSRSSEEAQHSFGLMDSHVAHPKVLGKLCFHDTTNDNPDKRWRKLNAALNGS